MFPPGSICVIFNPAAGRGRADRVLGAIRHEKRIQFDLRPTTHPGHAVELARLAATEGYPIIAAAGGDGTVHEVANGILQANHPDTIFSPWPVGSANDYAHALGVKKWWKRKHPPLVVRSVDVGQVSGGGKSAYYVNCLGVGFNGAVTLESRQITWLRGMPLYSLATLRALWRRFDQPRMRVTFDDRTREVPTLAISVNLGPREGNFPVTPEAKLDDGLFDAVHAGPLTRWQAIKLLPRMATGTLKSNDGHLWLGRCRSVTVHSPTPVRVHIDGEFFCQPEQNIKDLTIELLPARLKVLGTPPPPCVASGNSPSRMHSET